MTAVEYRGASAAAIEHHYDVGDDFYRLWLDPTLSYSCAMFEGGSPDEPLETAQLRKLDHMIRGARAAEADQVLDIGCGWGALLRRLVERHGLGRVTGLTLSPAQAASVRAWADDRYDVRVQNWADHDPGAQYGAVISIGAFEHFADIGMVRAERVAGYRDFFQRCHRWLPPGGRLALQTNVKGNNVRMDRQTVRDLLFIIDRIFPESELPWPSEIFEAGERLFDVVSVRNDPDDYARTCRQWRAGLLAGRERAIELVGEQTFADYDRYLAAASAAFTKRHLGLFRVIFERV